MSIAGIMMQRMGMGLQYSGASNACSALDGKLSLARSVSPDSSEATFRDLAKKDLQYDLSVQGDHLDYIAGQGMYEQGKRLQKDWADSFRVFCD